MLDVEWLEAIRQECQTAQLERQDIQEADAFRELSDDETLVDSLTPCKSWFWLDSLREHLTVPIKQSGPVSLLSSCTGSFSEGEVLEAGNCD